MVSKLVLVRHAKTQTRSLELADRDRQLTRAGRRSVEARFPVTLRLVEDVSAADLKVWSSPALRALQTAEVVARVLGIDGIEVEESLYTQDAERFEAELVEESGCVIAVGHNPFMEELCRWHGAGSICVRGRGIEVVLQGRVRELSLTWRTGSPMRPSV